MPLSAVPYKLSITYIHLFLSRYQYPVFHRSYQRLRSIIAEKEKVPQDNQGTALKMEIRPLITDLYYVMFGFARRLVRS